MLLKLECWAMIWNQITLCERNVNSYGILWPLILERRGLLPSRNLSCLCLLPRKRDTKYFNFPHIATKIVQETGQQSTASDVFSSGQITLEILDLLPTAIQCLFISDCEKGLLGRSNKTSITGRVICHSSITLPPMFQVCALSVYFFLRLTSSADTSFILVCVSLFIWRRYLDYIFNWLFRIVLSPQLKPSKFISLKNSFSSHEHHIGSIK